MGTFHRQPFGKASDHTLAGEKHPRGAEKVDWTSGYGKKVYRYYYNAHSASRAAGLPCFMTFIAATYPGMEVTQAATGNLPNFAGVHAESVTSGAWGWVQAFGYYAAAVTRKYGSGSNKHQAAGSYLGPGINAIDALPSCASAECEPDAAGDAANTRGYCITTVSQASHSDQSTTTTTQAVHIFGVGYAG